MTIDTKTDKQKLQEATWDRYVGGKIGETTDILEFVETWEPKPNPEETIHICYCIDAAMQELCGICPCGSFGKAVLANDLAQAVSHADQTNSKWLKIYVSWFYLKVPANLLYYYRNPQEGRGGSEDVPKNDLVKK